VALVPYLRRTLMTSFPMRTKLMRTSSAITGLLSCGGLSLFFVCSAQARITVSADPEDSPLYAVSRENAIADMRRRDHVVQAFGAAGVETILVVEGKQWRTAPASGRGPRPLGVTTDISCGIPTMCTSCTPTSCASDPSCGATPTCRGSLSCHVPMPTCYNFTCGPGPTCVGNMTCQGYPTCGEGSCGPGLTCTSMPTCSGSQTCVPGPTCTGTCVPANCQVALYDVNVPQVGQIQLSFVSSAYLRYELDYCTNLAIGSWAKACSTNGNGGVLTLAHTNRAPAALYRLWILNP